MDIEAMYKEQVAECLGVSVRAVERYTADGKLSIAGYEKQARGGQKAVYDRAHIEQFKLQMSQPQPLKAKEVNPDNESVAVMSGEDRGALIVQNEKLINIFEGIKNNIEKLIEKPSQENSKEIALLEEIAGSLEVSEKRRSLEDLTIKLLLTIDEASGLSGASVGVIKKAIKAGQLKGLKLGRALQVKREDLEVWVKGL